MSVEARKWAHGRVRKKLAAALFAIADYADVYGITFVGQATLASDCGCHRRTFIKDLNELEKARLITRVRSHDDGGHRGLNYIVVAANWDDRGKLIDAPDEACDGEDRPYPDDVIELARKGDVAPANVLPAPPRQRALRGDLGGGLGDENTRLGGDTPARTEERRERDGELSSTAEELLHTTTDRSTEDRGGGSLDGDDESPPSPAVVAITDAVVVDQQQPVRQADDLIAESESVDPVEPDVDPIELEGHWALKNERYSRERADARNGQDPDAELERIAAKGLSHA